MAKMVKCKSCGADIAKTARTCPYCGAQQHTAALVACVFIVLITLGLIFAVLVSADSGPEKVGSVDDSSGPQVEAASSSGGSDVSTTSDVSPAAEEKIFGVGDQVNLNDVLVTLVDVKESNGANYMNPQDGNVFLLCEFEIENNSKSDFGVSSIMSFEAYVNDYSTGMSLTAILSSGEKQLDGSVAAGKKINGVIGYEVPSDWETFEIRFNPDVFFGDDIIFSCKK